MPNRALAAAGVFWCAAIAVAHPSAADGQNPSAAIDARSARTQLLEKAHALEVRGKLDLAVQTWQQTLLVDPNSTEALAGLARAAKLGGRPDEAQRYLDRLRAVDPTDRSLREIAGLPAPPSNVTAAPTQAPVERARALAAVGQYVEAMALLRQTYGSAPPAGDAAALYYTVEGATVQGRPQAVAALRALVDQYPQDARYKIALGEVLSRDPRTRAEGSRYLAQAPAAEQPRSASRLPATAELRGGTAPITAERGTAAGTGAGAGGTAARVTGRETRPRYAGAASPRVFTRTQPAVPGTRQGTAAAVTQGVQTLPPQPAGPEAQEHWLQTLGSLHARGQNAAVVTQVEQLPPELRVALDRNPVYLRLLAEVYAELGDAGKAATLLRSAEGIYAEAHLQPPADLELRRAALLLMAAHDAELYVQLMSFGGRSDLTDAQRREAQQLWVRWAMRRAATATAAGNRDRALLILNAAATSFRDNDVAMQMLAGEYVADGFAPFAVERFRRQALGGTSGAPEAAPIEASLAAGDLKSARRQVQAAIAQHPGDPELLLLGARVEEARGDTKHAAAYYREALTAMPELGTATPGNATASAPPEELQRLLAPRPESGVAPGATGRPYLPSYAPGSMPVPPLQPEPPAQP